MTELRWPVDAEREREPEVTKLFRCVRKYDATGLELQPGLPPKLWLRGELVYTDMRPLTAEDMDVLFRPILWPDQRDRLARGERVAFTYCVEDGQRFWVTAIRLGGGLQLSAQRIGGPET